MALYELAVVGGAGTNGVAQCEFRAGSAPAYIREIGVFLNAATASTIGIGRPANNGSVAGGTLAPGQPNNQDDASPVGGIVASGWSTAPTAPTQLLRRIGLPAAIGNGMVFTWGERGLRIKQNTSLVIWNLAASSVASIYIVWEE
jgi:hypothetical protein